MDDLSTSDVVVGAPYRDSTGNASGSAHVYFGGPGADAAPDWILDGEAGNDHFGWAVGGGDDVDGDGFDDVVIGARLAGIVGRRSAGKVYFFSGGPSRDGVPDVTWIGQQANDWLGEAVAIAGDVNGDGYADVVAGSRFSDAGAADAGAAYLFLGGSPPASSAAATHAAGTASSHAGTSVAGLGDLDGDGFDEWAVGSTLEPGTAGDAGTVRVFCGAASPDAVTDLLLEGMVADGWCGFSVARGRLASTQGPIAVSRAVFDGRAGAGAGAAMAWSATCGTAPMLRADFTRQPARPAVGEDVVFDDLSIGSVVTWSCDLDGDGLGPDAVVPDPPWVYVAAGPVAVTLTVSDGTASDSITRVVEIGEPPGEVSAPGSAVPLSVRKGGADEVVLTFEELAGATQNAAYSGSIGSWYAHEPRPCAVPTTGAGTGALEATISQPGSAYLLVTASNEFGEGPAGRSSEGVDRGRLRCGG